MVADGVGRDARGECARAICARPALALVSLTEERVPLEAALLELTGRDGAEPASLQTEGPRPPTPPAAGRAS